MPLSVGSSNSEQQVTRKMGALSRSPLWTFTYGVVFGIFASGCLFYSWPNWFRGPESSVSSSIQGSRTYSRIKSVVISSTSSTAEQTRKLTEQRNQLSKLLNEKMKKIAQLECQKQKEAKGLSSGTGSYCEHGKSYHVTDESLVNFLKKFLVGKRVASFGEGPGQYKKLLTPFCEVYDGFDGAPTVEKYTNGTVHYLDLSVPQYGLSIYDIIISMEVAEHIPSQFESIFLDNIARHAQTGVILSWAKIGQGGQNHVNNRPLDYVVAQMGKRGFQRDESVSQQLKNAASVTWLKENLNYYHRVSRVSSFE